MERWRTGGGKELGLVALLLVCNGVFIAAMGSRYRAIVVHHSASRTGDHHEVRRAHRTRGWWEIAYHLVLSNGSTDVETGHLEPTWRYRLGLWSVSTRSKFHNLTAIHLCVIGNYEESPFPESLEGPLGHTLLALQRRFRIPGERILLHRDCSPTACPGQYVTQEELRFWSQSSASECPPRLRAQHRRALGSSLPFFAHRFPWALLNLLALWHLARRRRRIDRPKHLPVDDAGPDIMGTDGDRAVLDEIVRIESDRSE